MQNKIELLAPAKDLDSGIIAINAGADAVYIGATRFGARQAVGNSLGDIATLAAYAHKYWARVYAAVNILLYDHELDAAVQLCHQLYAVGIDAIIIQDMGLLESDLPPIPLFASTQMHNHTPERVAFLEQIGIQRVILARELSLDEIREIRKVTSVELETFIHGALCVSYSGQCSLSYAIGGRSGNRGQCAQPCRRRYSLVDGKKKTLIQDSHLLSLKDFNLSDYLRDLLDAGVCSFKIEGRLKDQAYVKNIVAHYRQRLNTILPDLNLGASSSGLVTHDFEPDPIKTFNRGYTSYHLTGERDHITSFTTPKHAGEPIGVVTSVSQDSFNLNVPAELNNGDGITYIDMDGRLQGTLVNHCDGNKVTPAKMDDIQRGVQICRNADRKFLKQVEKSQPDRRIPIKLRFSETPAGFQLSAGDQDGNFVEVQLTQEKVSAHKPDRALETLKRQLTRFGNSDFVSDALGIDLSEPYFFPVSTLNDLRRELVTELSAERSKNFPRFPRGAIQKKVSYPKTKLDFLGNVLNTRAGAFYRRHGVQEIEPAAESGIDMGGRKVMTTKHCLKYELGGCPFGKRPQGGHPHQDQPRRFNEPLYLVAEDGLRLRLAFNCRDCLMEIYFHQSAH
jgi:putative protease